MERLMDAQGGLKEVALNQKKFGAIDSKCNHMGGPLAQGKIKNGCVECPWHFWLFDPATGDSVQVEASKHFMVTPGSVPHYPLKEEQGLLFIDLEQESARKPAIYNLKGNLTREPKREPGKIRVLGISTTGMNPQYPRFSTSQELLKTALDQGSQRLDIETKFLALSNLNIQPCQGFYSKSAKACAWPCSITKMDPTDEMAIIYENLVHWADVVLVASPIRWGNASSLYYKMVERLNSVQNQITLKNKKLIQNKVVGLIITGGQDNIQSVAGQMLTFFGELGFAAPPFPFVAHSLGWSAEDMENNMDYVKNSPQLHEEAFLLIDRSVKLCQRLVQGFS